MSKPKKIQIRNSTAEFLVFTTQAGEKGIEVRVEDQTVWLTQKLIEVLFDECRSTITEHLQNIFATVELDEKAVCRNFRHTAEDGKSYLTAFYNLDAIIAVGFRVNSSRATQSRQWAIGILRDFAIRGYVLDKDRLVRMLPLCDALWELMVAQRHVSSHLPPSCAKMRDTTNLAGGFVDGTSISKKIQIDMMKPHDI